MEHNHVYRARCLDVIDGDTFDVVVDVGFNLTRTIRLRLADVDTHEVYGVDKTEPSYAQGMRESEFVREWMPGITGTADDEWPLLVETYKRGSFGRYLAVVERRHDNDVLNDRLVDEFDL